MIDQGLISYGSPRPLCPRGGWGRILLSGNDGWEL